MLCYIFKGQAMLVPPAAAYASAHQARQVRVRLPSATHLCAEQNQAVTL